MKGSRLVEWFFPSLKAWDTNRKIYEELKKKDVVNLRSDWKRTIGTQVTKTKLDAADELFETEIQRKQTIESKAASLFEAIGFAVSLLSIVIAFGDKTSFLLFSLLPLANFVLAGVCSWHATKIGKFYLPTLETMRDNCNTKQEKQSKVNWITEKLANTEMNTLPILMKSNWLSAASQHFLLGIISTIIFLAIVLLSNQIIQFCDLIGNLLRHFLGLLCLRFS
jgi:uncharacterized membrane protein